MSKSSNRSARRRGLRQRPEPMAEINVTPFVDVMLVLLIVFMVAAPLLTVGVPIDLPETDAKPIPSDKEPLTVSMRADGKVFIQDTEIAEAEVVAKLKAIAGAGYKERIFVRGDQDTEYGRIMKLMGRIHAAGFTRIGLVTLTENDGG